MPEMVAGTNLRQVASELFDLATESDQPLEIETLPVALPEAFQTALQILSPQRANDNLTGQTATMFQESVARMNENRHKLCEYGIGKKPLKIASASLSAFRSLETPSCVLATWTVRLATCCEVTAPDTSPAAAARALRAKDFRGAFRHCCARVERHRNGLERQMGQCQRDNEGQTRTNKLDKFDNDWQIASNFEKRCEPFQQAASAFRAFCSRATCCEDKPASVFATCRCQCSASNV